MKEPLSSHGMSDEHDVDGRLALESHDTSEEDKLQTMAYAKGHVNGHSINGQSLGRQEVKVNGSAPLQDANGHVAESSIIHNPKSRTQSPIAICGMALRLPAGLKTPKQLWEYLLAGGDSRGRVPRSRYNVDAFLDPSGKPGTVITEYGHFLDEDIGVLDTSFFSMPRIEVERADPQQRLMLEVTRECFEDAGETAWRGKRIGCYVGSLGEDWCEMFARETQHRGVYRYTGFADFMLSNRISYEMDLQGPSLTTRTACSSSLVALHEACMAIDKGDCDAAIVGGANLIMQPSSTTTFTEQGLLSPDGSCKTFSADANGYVRGEAINAVFIKRLDHALKDGNPIRAVIKGSATNYDGRTPSLATPSAKAQEELMRRTYEVAGITDVSETGFVECHGTGTALGDPIEVGAVGKLFGNSGVFIGSIKPNFGHTEGASGILSVIKAVLTLEHRTIPPNIKFSIPNPAIPFEAAKLRVPVKPTPWPSGRLERVSVNSFGVGGSNAHVILDSAASCGIDSSHPRNPEEPQLLLFSANSQQALTRMVGNYRDFVEKNPDCMADLAYTLALKREHLSHRTFTITNQGNMGIAPPSTKSTSRPSIIMVFTGQGAQWPRMGCTLMDSNSIFLNTIHRLDGYLQGMGTSAPEWTIEEELRKVGMKSRIHKAEFSQPLCTAIQIALVDVLASYGLHPSAVIGHSSGEIAGAYAAGALTAEEAIISACHRGAVTQLQEKPGSMAAIGMSWKETEEYLMLGVSLACDNSPKSVTISGDVDNVEDVLTTIRRSKPDVLARKLQVNKAYHSYHMAEVGDQYHALLQNFIKPKEPVTPFFSTVTGHLVNKSIPLDSKYWQQNLENPVLFNGTMSDLLRHGVAKNPVLLEIGPHSSLAGPLRQILAEESNTAPYISAFTRNQDCRETLLSALGKLWALGLPMSLNHVVPHGSCLSNLPPYPYDHNESYWHESRLSKDYRLRKYPPHDLLGVRIVESTDLEPSWRNHFHHNSAPWVRDHKVDDNIIFPFAGYVAIAGEAIRQMTEIDQTIKLRHILIKTALIVPEEKPIEIITTLRPHRLTDTLNSKWWEFSLSSHNGHTWTKHCTGEVTAQEEPLTSSRQPELLPRNIDSKRWFGTLREGGLDLGPAFSNLESISAGTVTHEAAAKLLNNRHAEPEKYHIHPTVVDSALQLMGIALTNGQARKFKNRLPTTCESFSISRTSSNFEVGVQAQLVAETATANAQGVVGGLTVLSIEGMKLAAVNQIESNELSDTHAAARQEWGPDIDFIGIKDLIRPTADRAPYTRQLDELSNLCLVSSHRRLSGLKAGKHHMEKYRRWIDSQSQSPKASPLGALDDMAISSRLDELVQNLTNTQASVAARTLQKVSEKIESIFLGDAPTWEDALDSKLVSDFHEYVNAYDATQFMQTLAHCKPNLSILELGSWRRSPSDNIMKSLKSANGQIRCSKYTFASRGSLFGQEKDVTFPDMEYITLDISGDLREQAFENRRYDLIIASNIIHTTRSISKSLKNIRLLLNPTGHLLLHELCPASKWINCIFGTQPRWWYGIEDGRLEEPYMDMTRWQNELVSAGFREDARVMLDAPVTLQLNGVIIAQPVLDRTSTKTICLLQDSVETDIGPVEQEFRKQGYEVDKRTIQDPPAPGQDVVTLLDKEQPFFETLDSVKFDWFKKLVQNLNGSGLFWVTQPAQVRPQDPRFAQVIGTARAMRSELLVDFATCEVADVNASAAQIVQTFGKFQRRDDNESLQADYEYVIEDGIIKVGRFYPFALTEERSTSESVDRAVLDVEVPGRLSTLQWVRKPALPSLKPDELEIEMHAVGLNFRDVLIAMNIVHISEGRSMGVEGSGIIRRIGSEVKTLQRGDRVAVLAGRLFATNVNIREAHCRKIPDDLTFDEAATMFFPFLTALHSLVGVGSLGKGQSVLIHSACGGVGLAALQVARIQEAELFVTVGSEEKVQYLMKNFDIPRNRIFNSRDNSFKDGIMRETQGRGVDVVLNSLSGDLLHATWECLAPFGKMVEIGKRDLIGNGTLNMNPFLANRSYSCVDIQGFYSVPHLVAPLFDTLIEWFQKKLISPLNPIEVFDATVPYDAFRFMQPGSHIGRICISLREPSSNLKFNFGALTRRKILELDSSASYLLVGGLGGLGRAISRWMVELGARHLIFLSRNAGLGSGDQHFVEELNSMGCDIQIIQGSVTSLDDCTRAIQNAHRPLKGILQMSMVLRDENSLKMTLEQWHAAVQPKVRGTWNLHNASVSSSTNLDFFVLFSSLSGIIGQPGQANYASANTFLDAFVQYRNSLGLPASAIDIGAVADVGYLSENRNLLQKMGAKGFKALKEQEVLDALIVAMTRDQPSPKHCDGAPRANEKANCFFKDNNTFVLGLGSLEPLSSPTNRAIWRRDRRMAFYHNAGSSTATSSLSASASSDGLKSYLASTKTDLSVLRSPDAAPFLAREIGRKLFALLLKSEDELNIDMSLPDLGMDSLVGIELRSWWKSVFMFDVSVLEMLGAGSLEALGQRAVEGLLGVAGAEAGASEV